MSISRRKFLKAGTLAGLFAGIPLGAMTAMGQGGRKDRDGNPGDQASTNNTLSFYTKSSFMPYVNSVFVLEVGFNSVPVTLLQVADMPAAEGGECFSLLFRGGDFPLRQESYPVEHPALGTFRLFLVPLGMGNNGTPGCLATINRLPLSTSLTNTPARLSKASGTVKPAARVTPPSNPPAPAISTPLVIGAPVQTTTSSPQTKPSGRLGRRMDEYLDAFLEP